MLYRIGIIGFSLCMTLFSRFAAADDTEATVRELEAGLIYESANQLADEEQYDRAIIRLDRIISEYSGTEYARLAADRKLEVEALKHQPEPIGLVSRASLVAFCTFFGTWTGMGTAYILEFDSAEIAGCMGCIAGPVGGMQGALKYTRDVRLSDGQASLISFGGAWGIWQATGAADLADAGDKGLIAASIAGGVSGLALSSFIVKDRYITPGDATMINFGGLWGTWFALCGAMIADLEDKSILASTMIGGDMGLVTMALLSPKLNMSRARARLINISGVVGTLYGLGMAVLFEIDDESKGWSALCIGSVLGLTAGTLFTYNYDAEKGYFSQRNVPGLTKEPTLSDFYSSTDTGIGRITDTNLYLPLISSSF